MKEVIAVLLSVVIFSLCIFGIIKKTEENIVSVISESASTYKDCIIILDAGHGGEDGGAVAFDNTLEKDINLSVCNCISMFFDLFGIEYVCIRTTDCSVGDTSLSTIRERKASDIHKRFDIINSYDNSVLLSIHQNMYAIEKYSGTQVFYSSNSEQSKEIAQYIQTSVKNAIQTENNRKIKAADNSIYLLYNAKRPSVMVECGFLSNLNELAALKASEYQSQMAYFITKGIIQYLIT